MPAPTHAPNPAPVRTRLPGPPLAAPLAAAALVTAAAHVPVTGEHLEEAFYIGALFIALEVASAVLAVALLVRPGRAVLAATAVVGALAVLALVISRTVGLPLIGDDVGNWAEPLAVVSLVAESAMVVGGLLALARPAAPTLRVRLAGVVAGALLLAAGAAATGLATSAVAAGEEPHGGTHSPTPGMRMDGMHGMHGMDMGRSASTTRLT